jgi:hypothetical protein
LILTNVLTIKRNGAYNTRNFIENFSQAEKELEEDKVIQNMTKEERKEKLALVNAVKAFFEDKDAHLKPKPLD